ncbi:serine hydroxymethyltransferase [Micromonospora marina]|uniref:Serine hydroxymethyltransferase n=1 Tax=Micromonospora marina TaxID=307120 RepID=A0A1C4ZMC6_9ACTN|nr:serine hydroxymethyltransferase [Micromonospora marina]SCF33931.1 glycine hydroxymethyltransferase [Micromonospora marina]
MTVSAHSDASSGTSVARLAERGVDLLRQEDPALHAILDRENRRQERSLVMVASSSVVDPSALACLASPVVNVTAEGYPGRRYHAGCVQVDEIEQLAIDRARRLFGAEYANVQPHSASVANELVLSALLRPGDVILGMDLHQGGHLTHGSRASFSGQYFQAHGYGLDEHGRIDVGAVRALARRTRPRLIICGATAYSRMVDFAAFRAVADEVGALLLADISHVAGLVVAGLHPSPVDHAHITTTCTHKQLFGPRGGLVLLGRDATTPVPGGRGTLAEAMQRSVFPFFQGAPAVNVIAAKARAFDRCATTEFRDLAARIVDDARALADAFARLGYRVVSGGTDNHIVLLDLSDTGLSGLVAQNALESVGILVNKNHVPGDRRPASVTSGLRLGTNTLAVRGAGPVDMPTCAQLADRVLRAVQPRGDRDFHLDAGTAAQVSADVAALCERWPLPRYPADGRACTTPAWPS